MIRTWAFVVPAALAGLSAGGLRSAVAQSAVFDPKFPKLDSLAVGEWWKRSEGYLARTGVQLDVPRDETSAFALYTHDDGELKMTRDAEARTLEEEKSKR